MTAPTIYSRIHILSDCPAVTFSPTTFPSVRFEEGNADVLLSLIGDADARAAFASLLRLAADRIEQWTEADGRAADVEAATDVMLRELSGR